MTLLIFGCTKNASQIKEVFIQKYCIYWYHLEEHSDPYTEGYIGCTTDIRTRMKIHQSRIEKVEINGKKYLSKFYQIARGLSKELKVDILHNNVSMKKAHSLELKYRPSENIGWNTHIGGNSCKNVIHTNITLFHKDNPTKEYVYKSVTEASKILGTSRGRILRALGRKSNTYGRDGWHVVHENTDKNTIISTGESISKSSKGSAKLQTRGKNNPKSKKIMLLNIESLEEFEFIGIAEACRTLGISYSALQHRYARKSTKPCGNWQILENSWN